MTLPSLALLAVLAQTASPSATPEEKAAAQSLLSEGTRLFNQGDFAAALEKFSAAYSAYASPKLLYNIAQTNRALGRFAEAMEGFERVLREAPEGMADMTSDVRASMEELRGKLGQLHIQCSMVQAEISLDGKVVGTSPLQGLIWAEAGKHQVTARHAQAIPVVEDVEVAPASVETVVLRLQPFAAVAGLATPSQAQHPVQQPALAAAEASDARAPAARGWWLGRTWTWVAAGTTVALLGSAAIVGASMQSRYDTLNRTCGSASGANYTGCSESDIQGVSDRKTAANVLWVLSGVGAVTTGVLFFVEGRAVTVAPVVASTPGLSARVSY